MQKTQTILVVDDEALNISILAEELSKHYEIRVAKSGQHAIDFLQTSHVDLILLDIMMPEMDGYEVFQRLRDNERTRHIPVIFITARNEDADEEKGLEMGAVDYIRKPFNLPSVRTRIKTHLDLKREQERSESLLLNILPAPIAARLKAGESNIADGYAEASILFADIVGFTRMASQISPKQLVVILNALFSRFDQLTAQFGVEKIKTIGDAYMVSAGVPVPRPDHAEAMAEMAFAMLAALREHNQEFGSAMQVRIGIASGPVVAGVIGLKRFIYDLWGDTVNLASRMESHGIPGAIQVSAETRNRLQGHYALEARGEIEIKGLGPTPAWLLREKIAVQGAPTAG